MKRAVSEKKGILILYAITFAYFLVCAFLIGEYNRDDYWFTEYPKRFDTLYGFLADRYSGWSSRVIIEAVLVALLKMPFTVWRFLFAIMFTFIPLFISYVTDMKNTGARVFTVLLVASFPLSYLNTAGWIATTLNYIFPLCALLISLFPLIKIYKGEKTNIGVYICSILLSVFAANQEQTLALLLGFSILGIIVLSIRDKKIYFSILPFIVIGILEMIFILKCPGNAIRSQESMMEFLPRFANWNIPQKIYYGAFHAINYMFYKKGSLLTAVLIMIAVIIFEKRKAPFSLRIISWIEFGLYILGSLCFRYYHYYIPEDEGVVITRIPPAWIGIVDFFLKIFGVTLFVLLIVIIFNLGKSLSDRLLCEVIFLGGYASAAILGFSPTLYASSTRIFVFMYFAIIIITAKIISNNDIFPELLLVGAKEKSTGTNKRYFAINTIMFALCALVVLLNLFLNIRFAILH